MIGRHCVILPGTVIYEGAYLEDGVIVSERCTIGSLTRIGEETRILYGAQIHDNVAVGESSIIAGFIADNTVVGNNCHVFGALIHRYENPDSARWDEIDEVGPTLEENVIVAWGAVIAGPVKIGQGAYIPPNVVCAENVAPGCRYEPNRNDNK